jgi:hypothetical protein
MAPSLRPGEADVPEGAARSAESARRASRQEETSLLKVEDLEMDLISHRVTRNGRRIDLQPLGRISGTLPVEFWGHSP